MKKLYSIIALLVLFAAGARADNLIGDNQTITLGEKINSASDITTGLYVLQNAKTKMFYCENESGNAVVMSDNVTKYSVVKINVSKDDSNNNTCTIEAYSGNCYGNLVTSAQITTGTTPGTYLILAPTTISDSDLGSDMGIWFKNGNNYINRSDNNTQGTGFTGTGAYSRQYVYRANIVNAVNVTYKLVDSEGNSLSSIVADVTGTAVVGSTPTAPSAFQHDYVTLTPNTQKVEESTTEIIFTATVSEDCPIKFSSDFGNATWYQVKFANSSYWAYNPNNIVTPATTQYKNYYMVSNTIDIVNDSALWAFSGNPYQMHIWNKGAGKSQELHLCNYTRPTIEDEHVYNGGTISEDQRKWTTWSLGKSTYSRGGSYILSSDASSNNYLNNNRDQNKDVLGIWQNPNAKSNDGSAITFTAPTYTGTIFDNITEATVVDKPKWGEVEAVVSGELEAFNTDKAAYVENPSAITYANVIADLDYALGTTPSIKGYSVKYKGSDGFVNIKCTSYTGADYSISLKDATASNVKGQPTDIADANQLWLVTSLSNGKVRLFNVNAQKYIQGVPGGQDATAALGNDYNFQIIWSEDGSSFKLLNDGQDRNSSLQYMCFETSNEARLGNLNAWSGGADWAATPVTSINLPIHAVGELSYATICYPFEVELSDGEAYTATFNAANSSLSLAPIGQTVPAGTPVVVVVENATSTSITATIKGTETKAIENEGNSLSGTYLPLAITAESNNLTLGTDGTAAGFYKWNGTLKNKAFFTYSGDASSKGFAFSFDDDDPTGISEDLVKEAVLNLQKPIYNVQGQRVGADYKGIIIQDGKKFLQK